MKTLEDNIARLQAILKTQRFGRACRWYDAVGSTNSTALDWAGDGATTGSLVVADFQEHGRGRFDRVWTADPGKNLTFTVIIEPGEVRPNLGLLPLAAAVAVTEALTESIEPHRPLVKWPNDVILTGKKVCGILTESSLPSDSADRGGRVVIGIGLNVNQDRFPKEISESATSLFRVLGRQVDRVELLAGILKAMESVYEEIRSEQPAALIRRYQALMLGIGETARFTRIDAGDTTEGTILGVDQSGGLQVQTKAGIQVLRAGEVTIRSSAGLPQAKIARLPDPSLPTTSS